MVKTLDSCWDSCPNEETYYPKGLLNAGVYSYLKENTETIFIKVSNGEKRAWEGFVFDIREDKNEKILYFKVNIKEEIPFPDEYANYSEGWYLFDDEADTEEADMID
jgi:hypothetical protein